MVDLTIMTPIGSRHLILFCVLAATCATAIDAQPVLKITAPASGVTVSPGQTITVSVSARGTVKNVFVIGWDPIGASQAPSAPPYNFTIEIPEKIRPGEYLLTAVGVSESGPVESESITIDVERPDKPVSLWVWPSAVEENIGESSLLQVEGTYADGTSADLTNSRRTIFVSDAPAIATVDQQGRVTAVASGSATILVNGSAKVPVTVKPAMTLVPLRMVLRPSQKQHYFARRADYSVPSVVWSIRPVGLGTISDSGDYIAPASVEAPQRVLVIAKDTSNDAIYAMAEIHVEPDAASRPARSSCDELPVRLKQGTALKMVDPVPDLLYGNSLITDAEVLGFGGSPAHGLAADGVSTVVMWLKANFVGERLQLSVLNEAGVVSGSTSEDGALGEIPNTDSGSTLAFKAFNFVPGQVTVAAVQTNEGPLAFALYRAPSDFVRFAADENKGSRGLTFRIQSLDLPCYSFTWPPVQ